jgi:hypothetical protein
MPTHERYLKNKKYYLRWNKNHYAKNMSEEKLKSILYYKNNKERCCNTRRKYRIKSMESHTSYVKMSNCPFCSKRIAIYRIIRINKNTLHKEIQTFGYHVNPYHYVRFD